ncbi:MAG: metal-dependent hydrolase [Deltaproteobacteria bacterium]|nr:metal-dependent hydrolase [Kofleriaceae bacterium]
MVAVPATDPAVSADIPRRQVDFDFDPARVPVDWYQDDAYVSTLLDALSLLFPEGERFFVDSVKALRHHVRDPQLDAAVDGFIGQEAMHGKEHRAFNEMFLAQGYTSSVKLERQLKGLLRLVRRALPARSQLAATCALEHFTAMMAEAALREEGMRDGMHPAIRPLWVWHALEESEHKAVAFDVYGAAGGGYARRAGVMLLTTIIFFAFTLWVQTHFLAERRLLWKPWRWLRGVGHVWVYPGWFTRLVPAYLQYFRPGFHPDDRDTAALLATWRERLFGDGGELRANLRGAWVQ